MPQINQIFDFLSVIIVLVVSFELIRVLLNKEYRKAITKHDHDDFVSLLADYRYTKILLLCVLWLHFAQKAYQAFFP